jgi:hypothetical protein
MEAFDSPYAKPVHVKNEQAASESTALTIVSTQGSQIPLNSVSPNRRVGATSIGKVAEDGSLA